MRSRDQIKIVRPGARETVMWIPEPRTESYNFSELVGSGRRHLNIMESVDTDLITPYVAGGYVSNPNDAFATSALHSRA